MLKENFCEDKHKCWSWTQKNIQLVWNTVQNITFSSWYTLKEKIQSTENSTKKGSGCKFQIHWEYIIKSHLSVLWWYCLYYYVFTLPHALRTLLGINRCSKPLKDIFIVFFFLKWKLVSLLTVGYKTHCKGPGRQCKD